MAATEHRPSELIAAAAEWRLIGLLLERPRPGWREEIAALAAEILDDALHQAATAAQEATEGEYLRLLAPGGSVSPREVTYRPREDPGHILADLAATYQAFSFQPHTEESIDHIAIEAGFVGYLFLKEAFADTRGDEVAAATTAAARCAFIDTHLAAMAGPFAQRVRAAAPTYLLEPAEVLASRVPVPDAIEIPEPPVDLPDTCGSCPVG